MHLLYFNHGVTDNYDNYSIKIGSKDYSPTIFKPTETVSI